MAADGTAKTLRGACFVLHHVSAMPESADRTRNLDHAAFGNGRVLALVSPTAAIEWLCLPRFDSPSIFARLLDQEKGGTFRVLSGGREIEGRMTYVPNTNVVSTVFEAEGGRYEVVDFAPRIPEGLSVRVPIEIARVIRPLSGTPRISIDFDPRPNYARDPANLRESVSGIEADCGSTRLHLYSNIAVPHILGKREFGLRGPVWLVMSYGARTETPDRASVQHDLDSTIAGWRMWSKTCALPSFEPAEVLRSALCLKLHAYHDTGAIIAATTTSIPEALGTERTWDYRYCWLRDAAFVVEALRRLSHLNEGERLMRYLRDVVESGPLQPLYGIGGERDLEEQFLPHMAGYCGNGYVRIGNAASEQRQHDLMGEVILCLDTFLSDPRIVHDDPAEYFPLIEALVEMAISAAPEPDTGIWEFRTLLRHYTFSKAMCWVAIHRGAVLAKRFGREILARRWEQIAADLRHEVLERGYSSQLGFFTQALDGQYPDASNLLLPSIGIIDARDPRFVSTVRAYERLLVENGLMLRYKNDDDFGHTTSAFTICSFWWAEALALMGELDRSAEVFRSVAAHANPVGLFSEDVDPRTGALLGNFPQAYTHVGLIHAAMTIGELLDVREGRARAWT
jgi:GH15 family glucan-1,4-alpha-glucosidase